MSISGMTGFARAQGEHEDLRWVWEAKSVNGRGLDLKLRLPSGFESIEPVARAAAQSRFKRGSLQLSLALSREAARGAPIRIDLGLIETLIAAGQPYVESGRAAPPRWDGLLALRGVISAEEAEPEDGLRGPLDAALLEGLNAAFDILAESRQAEGRMLAGVLGEAAGKLDQLIAAARVSAAAAPAAALERIRQRLAALAPEVQLDPLRLAQEAALAAARADVAEELERLAAHTLELRALLQTQEPAGRRLDFLSQELTREANTLCSKSADLELTRIGLDIKAVVDQIKEQAANVE